MPRCASPTAARDGSSRRERRCPAARSAGTRRQRRGRGETPSRRGTRRRLRDRRAGRHRRRSEKERGARGGARERRSAPSSVSLSRRPARPGILDEGRPASVFGACMCFGRARPDVSSPSMTRRFARAGALAALFVLLRSAASAQTTQPQEFPFAVGAGGFFVNDTGRTSETFSTGGFHAFFELDLDPGVRPPGALRELPAARHHLEPSLPAGGLRSPRQRGRGPRHGGLRVPRNVVGSRTVRRESASTG